MNDYIPLNNATQDIKNTIKDIENDPYYKDAINIVNQVLNQDSAQQYVPIEKDENYPNDQDNQKEKAQGLIEKGFSFLWDNKDRLAIAIIGAVMGRLIANKLIK